LATAGLTYGSSALAAAPKPDRFNFVITAKSTSEALIDLALQSGITIGGGANCQGRKTALTGRFTVAEGLDRLLNGAACRYEFIDAHTVRVVALAPPPRPEVSKPIEVQGPAEPQAELVSTDVQELVITATKRPGFTGDFPGALSVVGGAELTDTGVTDTESIARQSSSFITTNLGPARNKILLRGLSDGAFTGRTQSTVGTYLDDVPITYNAPDPDLRLADVQDVEILRGPQGALYGGGSLSGIYRIVTRKPQFDETSASVDALVAGTQGGAPSTEIDAVFNAPLVEGRAAGRVVFYDDQEGGYIHDDALRESNVDSTDRAGGRAAIRLLLNDHWTAMLSTAVQDLSSADTQYLTVENLMLRRSNQVRETHHNDFAQVALNLSGGGDWGRFESSTAVLRHDYASRYDASAVLTAFGADPADDVGLFDEAANMRRVVEDAFWSSPETGRLHFLGGVFGSISIDRTPSQLTSKRGATGMLRRLYEESRRDALNEYAAYGEATYDLGGGWTAAAGARAFQTDVHTTSTVTVATAGQVRNLDKSHNYNGVSPKLSLQRQWANGDYIYALASSGYRAGGFNTGGLLAPSANIAMFRPDHLQNYEMGGEVDGWNGRLKLKSALFYDHWTDIQTDQYLVSGLSYTANVGDGRNIGWESEVTYQLTPRLRLEASSLVDRPQVTSLNSGFTSIIGARLPGVPNAAFSGLLTYERPIQQGRTLLLTAQVSYTGSSRLTFDSRFSPLTPSYYTADLSAQLKTKHGRLAAFISNPLNSSKDTFSYGNPFSFGQVRQVTPQRPRTVSLLLSRSF
jgi:iron complex outermembrane receptor protein